MTQLLLCLPGPALLEAALTLLRSVACTMKFAWHQAGSSAPLSSEALRISLCFPVAAGLLWEVSKGV